MVGDWGNYHLHEFIKDNKIYSSEPMGSFTIDSENVQVKDLLKKKKDEIMYVYDLGDSWNHIVLLEKILPYDDKIKYPICIDGKRNFPLEDGRGVYDDEYEDELSDSDYEDYEELGPGYRNYDPEYFNKEEINNKLNTLFN